MKRTEKMLLYALFLLIIISVCSSFVRSFIQKDYYVSYETDCDPKTHSCFVHCQTSTCDPAYFYKIIEKKASLIQSECGENISKCAEANHCQESSNNECKIIYCDPADQFSVCDQINRL